MLSPCVKRVSLTWLANLVKMQTGMCEAMLAGRVVRKLTISAFKLH